MGPDAKGIVVHTVDEYVSAHLRDVSGVHKTDSLSEWYANSLKSRVTAKAAFLGPLPATRQTPHGRRIPGRRRQGRLSRFSSGTNYTT
jgi:hypothetical protein